MVPHLVRTWSTYKDIKTLILSHTHTQPVDAYKPSTSPLIIIIVQFFKEFFYIV